MRKPANGYRFPESTFREMEKKGVVLYGEDENRIVKIKKYVTEYEDALRSVISLDGRLGSYELKRLFPESEPVFTNPKPAELLEALVSFASDSESIVLDFFAGSGSTGHAVLELNKKERAKRKFILVQLPEPTGRDDYLTISDIAKERVRRVINRLNEADTEASNQLALTAGTPPSEANEEDQPDRGFRVFKLAESNFKPWNAQIPADAQGLEQQLELHIDHIRPDRGADDLLYEILLKSGYPLTAPVETLTLAGKQVHSVAGGLLFICLERELTLEAIRAMAERKPERVVCLDDGFAGNDQLKANAVQIFKTKGVTSFKTV